MGKPLETWFSLAVVVLGLNCLLKSCFFNLDASLYLGSLLIFIGVASFLQTLFLFSIDIFYPWYIFSLAFASLMVFSLFRQKIHLKLFGIITLEVLILFMYKYALLSKVVFYVINIMYLSLVALLFIRTFKKNTRG